MSMFQFLSYFGAQARETVLVSTIVDRAVRLVSTGQHYS